MICQHGAAVVSLVVDAETVVSAAGVGASVGYNVAEESVDEAVVGAVGDALTGASEGWCVGRVVGVNVVGAAVASHGHPSKAPLLS